MNDIDPGDRRVGDWLRHEAPQRAPDRLGDAVRLAVDGIGQRSPGGVFGHLWSGWPWPAPVLVALGAIALSVVVLSAIVRPAGPSHGGPGPSNVPTSAPPSTVASSVPSPAPTVVGNLLPTGLVMPDQFLPRLRFEVPDGWVQTEDREATYYLNPTGGGWMRLSDDAVEFDGIQLFKAPVAGPPDGGPTVVAGIGRTARDLATWLRTRPQLIATDPVQTTIAGRPAYQLDFRLSTTAGVLCGMPCVNLLNDGQPPGDYQFGILGTWQVRAILVDGPDDTTVLIALNDVDGSGLDELAALAQPILDSMEFLP